jgi:ornithine carbamoyltransferase
MKHFLQETDCERAEAEAVFTLAGMLKANRRKLSQTHKPLAGQTWGLLFSKNSTRTRVSFEVGLRELGAETIFLEQKTMQIDRGETIADTAQVLSRYLHGLVIRTHAHEVVTEFARYGSIPVVNALTDLLHPCQIYADAFTLAERWGGNPGISYLQSLPGHKLVYYGDCSNNMALSWLLGGAHFGIEVVLSGPESLAPNPETVRKVLNSGGFEETFTFEPDPLRAAEEADVLYTDVWVSMGQEADEEERTRELEPYRVSRELMHRAKPDACFMHCLPAHEGVEVEAEVLRGPQSIIFDQAENRLHVQKAILERLAGKEHSLIPPIS